MMAETSPRTSTSSGSPPAKKSPLMRGNSPLSIDMSDLPGLVEPAPPSNTLLVTRLTDPRLFTTASLSHLKDMIHSQLSSASEIYTFSPLPSLCRIIIIFHSVSAAQAVRNLLDGMPIMTCRMRVYYGADTDIGKLEKSIAERQLRVPQSTKQFFISPPPSPPHGWESKNEDPPNKEVHPEDLIRELELIERGSGDSGADAAMMPPSPTRSVDGENSRRRSGDGWDQRRSMDFGMNGFGGGSSARQSRSSTIVFDPVAQGTSPDLPAIAVEDMSFSPGQLTPNREEDVDMLDGVTAGPEKKILAHTSRPPVELMD